MRLAVSCGGLGSGLGCDLSGAAGLEPGDGSMLGWQEGGRAQYSPAHRHGLTTLLLQRDTVVAHKHQASQAFISGGKSRMESRL